MSYSAERITNSALWAAYGDALGFPTELVDLKGLKRRLHADRVDRPIPWKKLVGGKFGATVELPAGAYSDDTQLRLATSRSIDKSGLFDVETFAKVELPVWSAYALGGGLSSKAAATSLSSADVNWFSNFYHSAKANYVLSGGNGAAMRIQPIVWAGLHRRERKAWLGDVIRNSICTHGHPRAIAGAVLHALCLESALKRRRYSSPDEWYEMLQDVWNATRIIAEDAELGTFWLPTWTKQSGSDIRKAFDSVCREIESDISVATSASRLGPEEGYKAFVDQVGGTTPSNRGSGIVTTLAAAMLTWQYRNEPPEQALLTAVNYLNSDTDTIASMAGAILGAMVDHPPPYDVQDAPYIRAEAERLTGSKENSERPTFHYPDLLQWRPPRTQLDAVDPCNGQYCVAGLGYAMPISGEFPARAGDACWQWMRFDYGQTILAKRRLSFKMKRVTASPTRNKPETGGAHEMTKAASLASAHGASVSQPELFGRADKIDRSPNISINQLTNEVIRSNFDPRLIGQHLLDLSQLADGVELAIGYSAIIAKARRARIEASRPDR